MTAPSERSCDHSAGRGTGLLCYSITSLDQSNQPAVRSKLPRLPDLFAILLMAVLPAGVAATPPRVVASIAPLHSLVAAVMKDAGTPQLLLRGGESPHTFSLRPSDARMLNDADVLFWIGPTLELPLARIIPKLGVSHTVSLLDSPGLALLPNRQRQLADHHGQVEAGDIGHAADTAGIDPHIWLSPANAAVMADEIARRLARIDPKRSGLYASNATQLQQRLLALDREIATQLGRIQGNYAVFHDAYQYFEAQYGLQPVATVTTHPERSPGASHLHRLRATLANQQVRCLFSEPQYPPGLVSMLSGDLQTRHAVLDPLGADIPPGPEAYMQMMRAIAKTLSDCMQGDDTP